MDDVGTPGDDTTLVGVLRRLAADGYAGQLIASDEGLRCSECQRSSLLTSFDAVGYRRLEGASDPADMNLIVWGPCPSCGHGSVVILGYGPNASAADEAALAVISLDHVRHAGALDDEDSPTRSD